MISKALQETRLEKKPRYNPLPQRNIKIVTLVKHLSNLYPEPPRVGISHSPWAILSGV